MTSTTEAVARAEPPEPTLLTVPVERGTLDVEAITRGVLVRTDESVLQASEPSDPSVPPVVTATPVGTGDELVEGTVVLEVGGRPVFVLQGDLPILRDLRAQDSGVDVDQLRVALARLGFLADGRPGPFDWHVIAALGSLYRSHGFAMARTSPDEGGTARGYLPRSEVVWVPDLPRVVVSADKVRGDGLDGPFARIATSDHRLEAHVTAATASALTVGTRGTADDLAAGISFEVEVVAIAKQPGQGDQAGRFAVMLAPTVLPPPGAVGLSLRVRLPIDSSDPDALIVPLSALFTRPDGVAAVDVVEESGTRQVRVTVGLAGGGRVVVEPVDGSLSPGDRVVVGVASG